MYAPFVSPGDLVFDVGAHVGDRTRAFADLGCRVVALEPQDGPRRWLKRMAGGSSLVTIRPEAVGRAEGRLPMAVSRSNPTVSTLSEEWRGQVQAGPAGFEDVTWDARAEVSVTTLDQLICRYGLPRFCKIDVEGWEAEVLAGLSHLIPALSVEFVAGTLGVARACVDRLEELGTYEFNVISGEERTFRFSRWILAGALGEWLEKGADGLSSGDIYARVAAATPSRNKDVQRQGQA